MFLEVHHAFHYNRDLMVESTCDSLYHNAYHFAEYLPQCFAYLEALFEFADELNPCSV